ncbi:hypothetical protein BDV28DRAFT_41659 [Aspergillus coremiiformis]|uniref:Glycosyl transferase CAP10 domain-containing protein n=1 Tax=Aspergillus coremiiformis TaxID=138285 RepID=A0A5N6ZGU2_9EURO|nr:hypothetical protein BDV28DRAFT_41659 [Aspergillus coremiiformis]
MRDETLLKLTSASQPLLTPFLLIAERCDSPRMGGSSTSDTPHPIHLIDTVWVTGLAGLFVVLTLGDWDRRGFFLSILPVAALLIVYAALTPRIGRSTGFLPIFDMEASILPLSRRVVCLLLMVIGVETVVFGFVPMEPISTLTSGLTKALTWYCMAKIARHCSWRIATTTRVFAIISTRNPFTLASNTQALFLVIASILTLGQVIHILPGPTKSKSTLWAFALVPLVSNLANFLAIRNAQSLLIHSGEHPIEQLIQEAKLNFARMLQRQSQDYTAAYEQYRHRYGVEPPPGFEAWYEFAKLHQSPIIDEFDVIYNAVSPFWKLSGQNVLDIINDVHRAPQSELWLCIFSGQQATVQCSHAHRTFDRHIELSFNRLLGALGGVLPDVRFLVNHLDEPRVLIPPRMRRTDTLGHEQINLTNLSRQPVWDKLTEFCSSQERGTAQTIYPAEPFTLSFVADISSAIDLCQNPEYGAMHGLTLSPTSFRLVEGAVLILSTGALSTMGDILYPSAAYNESEFIYDERNDVEWERKHNNLYWAGSTTGGFAMDGMWRQYHRQRFVELAQNLKPRRRYCYLRQQDGVLSQVRSSFLNGRLFDVAFTRIMQCEPKYCREQDAYFNVKSWVDKDKALRSRLVFDIDGNGISGRYYKLLASKSLPLKQTLFREWHDDRLRPWVHYIPVSQDMEELPEMVLYLTSTESGQIRAREIADQGRSWFTQGFRDIDQTIYLYRLLLELARLQDPSRPAM